MLGGFQKKPNRRGPLPRSRTAHAEHWFKDITSPFLNPHKPSFIGGRMRGTLYSLISFRPQTNWINPTEMKSRLKKKLPKNKRSND